MKNKNTINSFKKLVFKENAKALRWCYFLLFFLFAIGTTSVRALESASQCGEIKPYEGETDIFIYPGYEFKTVDAMVTNFHLSESTLLMLVSAFAGKQNIMNAYQHAIEQRYRFFSYGDAMFIS